MPSATLLKPSTYTLKNLKFVKGVKQPVTETIAAYLDGNKRFIVDWGGVTPPEKPLMGLADNGSPVEEGEEEPISLLDAIDQVDVDREENFGEDGKPTVEAISAIMGREVTVEERDAAMDRVAANPATALEPAAGQPAGRTRIVRKVRAADPTTEGAQEV